MKLLRTIGALFLGFLIAAVALEGYARLSKAVGFGFGERVANEYRDKKMVDALVKGKGRVDEKAFRVLVLGDSMAFSPGIPRAKLWSYLLQKRLQRALGRKVVVVNAALPGANASTYVYEAGRIVPKLRPQLVLLVYSYNDVYGSHVRGASTAAHDRARARDRAAAGRGATTAQRLRRLSVALRVLVSRINLQAKAWGIRLPGSQFHHLTGRAYTEKFKGWQHARRALSDLDALCKQHGARFGVFVMTPFDSLQQDHFRRARKTMRGFMKQQQIPVVFGYDWFKGSRWNKFAISPFDGHPNLRANKALATRLSLWLATRSLLRVGGGR